MKKFLILIFLIVPSLAIAEEYIDKVELFIPYGEADSLLGYQPPYYQIKAEGDTGHIELGRAAGAWDVQNDKIYVSDVVKKKILVYSLEGKYLKSVGLWKEDTNEVQIKTSTGKILTLQPQKIQRSDSEEKKLRKYPEVKHYYSTIGSMAVDGSGNIYAVTNVSYKERGVMKFSPDGRLLGIINKFGKYGPDDIESLGFGVYSNKYSEIIVRMFIKKEDGVFAKFDRSGNFMWVKERAYPIDNEGNLYNMLPDGKSPSAPDTSVVVSKMNAKELEIKEIKICFGQPASRGIGFRGVDGKGNLFFSSDLNYLKYDQEGNLLAKIEVASIVYEKGLSDMRSIPMSKFMPDGSHYIGYNFKDGFRLIKQYIKPGTKGGILKPAITDTKKK